MRSTENILQNYKGAYRVESNPPRHYTCYNSGTINNICKATQVRTGIVRGWHEGTYPYGTYKHKQK